MITAKRSVSPRSIRPRRRSRAGSLLLLCLSWAVAHTGCSRSAEWTVMIYLNGDNTLESAAIQDFKDIARAGSTDRVNVVVQFDRAAKSAASTREEWSQTRRFYMTPASTPTLDSALPGYDEEANMGDGATLRAFVGWAQAQYPAKRYALVIWDHGQGWRLMREKLPSAFAAVNRAERKTRNPAAAATAAEISSGLLSISVDDSNGEDRLYNSEIAQALTALPEGKRVDLIAFDACLMGMLETAYAVRATCDVMVASEELKDEYGLPYERFLKALGGSPKVDAGGLGALIVQAEADERGAPGDHTLSAVNLRRVPQLGEACSTLADALIAELNDSGDAIALARKACREYGSFSRQYIGTSIDLGLFADKLIGGVRAPAVVAAANQVKLRLADCVIANAVGSGRKGAYGSTGLAIYFPVSRQRFLRDQDRWGYLESNRVFPVEFVRDHRWDNFLLEYFLRVEEVPN